MADPLYELLIPYFDSQNVVPRPVPPSSDPTTAKYLNRLTTLPLPSLHTTEPQSLSQAAHSTIVSLQALSSRSHKTAITSADHLRTLRTTLPHVVEEAQNLRDAIPKLDAEAVRFSSAYSKSAENEVLDRRKRSMLLARNVDRLSDILELPTLLSTAVSSSSITGNAPGTSSTNYSAALDLFAHIRRLQILYPESSLVKSVSVQAEEAMKDMTTNLISGLRSQNIRLAAAMRTVGWLRRVAPDLEIFGSKTNASATDEGSFGALFLICRLANLLTMLNALDPLRELADQETERRIQDAKSGNRSQANGNAWSGGQQTERYLKRYIEIFREQSFGIISMFKNVFPSTSQEPDAAAGKFIHSSALKSGLAGAATKDQVQIDELLLPIPSALATFPMHIVDLLADTLRTYLPNVRDRGSRDSLLTQVLYCAGSLGRLGGDFSLILALLEEDEDDDTEQVPEWEEAMKKHRVLAGKLEQLASGSADGKKSIGRESSPIQLKS